MIEIQNTGKLLDVDRDENIVSESNISKIKSPWKEAVEEIKQEYLTRLGHSVQSIYVRGTVSRGEAIENVSDIDTFAILNRLVTKDDRKWMDESSLRLQKKYPFATDIEFNIYSSERVFKEEEGYNIRFIIKVQSACVFGDDISTKISSFTTSIDTARYIQQNLPKIFEELHLELSTNISPEKRKELCRWVMKRILRASFILVKWIKKRSLLATYIQVTQSFQSITL